MSSKAAYLATALVVLSVAVNLLHTASHAGQHVMSLPGWQLAYIAVVIYAAPVVAAVLLRTRYRLAGAWLLAASMAGSFVFGLVLHFLVSGPDNVFTLPPGTWRTAFQVTAVLLLMLQMIGSLIGLWAAQRIPQPSTDIHRKRPAGGSRVRDGGPDRSADEPRSAVPRTHARSLRPAPATTVLHSLPDARQRRGR